MYTCIHIYIYTFIHIHLVCKFVYAKVCQNVRYNLYSFCLHHLYVSCTISFISYKAFLKNKKRSGNSISASSSA